MHIVGLRKVSKLAEEWLVAVNMEKKTFWIIAGVALAVLALLVIWQTMQISALSSGTSTVKAAATTAARASSGMVGGC